MDPETANQIVEEITTTFNLVTDIEKEVLPNKEVVVYIKIYVTYLLKANLEFILHLAEKYKFSFRLHSDNGYFTIAFC
jgi:hypothetical protein